MTYPGNIIIRVIQARNLPKKDVTGSIDPFFTFKVGKSTGKTSTKKNDMNPTYEETVTLSYNPSANTRIILVECFDWDRFSANDLVGTIQIPFEEFQNRRQRKTFPINDKSFTAQGELELEIIYEAAGAPAYIPPGGGGGGQSPPQYQQPPPQGPPQGYPPQGQFAQPGYPPQGQFAQPGYPQQAQYGAPPVQFAPQVQVVPQQVQIVQPMQVAPPRPIKIIIKQKALTVGADKFAVKDASGQEVLQVQGEFFAIGKCLHITDTSGREVAKIDERNTSMRYDIDVLDGTPYCFTIIEKKGHLDIRGLNWCVRGREKEKEFHVLDQFNMEVMHMNKESFTIGDEYEIYITNAADLIPCVCIGLIIDATFYD